MEISKHLTYWEAIRTDTDLENTPNETQLVAMKLLAINIFEPVRMYMREPVFVESFFRSKAINQVMGGEINSQHIKGEAIDLRAKEESGYTTADIFHYIREKLEFDQLIWKFGDARNPWWVHVSYKAKGNRNKVLRAMNLGNQTIYKKW